MGILLIYSIAAILIFVACDIGRKKDSKIESFTNEWILQNVIIIIALILMSLI